MVTTFEGDTKENPSRDNHNTEGCQVARQRVQKVVEELHTYFHEEGPGKGLWWYLDGEEEAWDEACRKKHEAREHYDNLRSELDGMWNFIAFRSGFLAGVEYARSGGAICRS